MLLNCKLFHVLTKYSSKLDTDWKSFTSDLLLFTKTNWGTKGFRIFSAVSSSINKTLFNF